MKIILLLLGLSTLVFASINESLVCKKCHPIIYKEYYSSSHAKASIITNPINKAIWKLHPEYHDNNNSCSKCHSPNYKKAGKDVSISCIDCHNIKDVIEEEKSNKNIINTKERWFYSADISKKEEKNIEFKKQSSLFGLINETAGSAYHKIDYTNRGYYDGNICLGCHSHRLNKHGIDTLMLDAKIDKNDKESCISCHMPQIVGSKVTLYNSKTHAYHGIAGIHQMSEKMGEFVEFVVKKTDRGFNIKVINKANHALFGHPLRLGLLKVELISEGKTLKLKPYVFERTLSKDGKLSMSWDADDELSDTLLYGKKSIDYDIKLKKGDKVALTLGLYLIKPLLLEKFKLQNNKDAKRFRVLKKELFNF